MIFGLKNAVFSILSSQKWAKCRIFSAIWCQNSESLVFLIEIIEFLDYINSEIIGMSIRMTPKLEILYEEVNFMEFSTTYFNLKTIISRHFHLNHFWQKFRESNGFTKYFLVREKFSFFPHCDYTTHSVEWKSRNSLSTVWKCKEFSSTIFMDILNIFREINA